MKLLEFAGGMIERLNILIDENFENSEFSIEFLCKEMGMSRANLHRKIKDQTGLSTSLYIRQRRLQKARFLIETTDLNFSEIAYSTGINNPQNFSKYFQKEYGSSPSEYRKEFLKQQAIEAHQKAEKKIDLSETSPPEKSRKEGIFYFVLGTIMIGVVLGLAFFSGLRSSKSTKEDHRQIATPLGKNSIAVLPFANLNEDGSSFFSDGVMEDILTNLARIPNLQVISRTSSMQYRNSNKTITEIAEELGVNYILEGSVRQYQDEVKITVQLIDANSDTHLWAQDYNRKLVDIFSIQSEVAKEIASALKQSISEELKSQFDRPPTKNMQAYNDFLTGRELIYSRTEQGILEGLKFMDRAINLDPKYADAIAYKGMGLNLLGNMNYANRKDTYEQSILLAQRAISIDAQNDVAYLVMGSIYNDQFKWQQSIDAYKKAFELNPNNALAFYWYSLLLREIGELKKAALYSAEAAFLDPLQPVIIAGHVKNCMYAGNSAEALSHLKKGKLLFENSFLMHWAEGIYYEFKEDYSNALFHYNKSIEQNPNVISILRGKMYILAKMGKNREVEDFINDLEILSVQDLITVSTAYCGLGDKKNCIKYLEMASSAGSLPDDIKVDPRYSIIHDTPQFKVILENFGFNNTFHLY